MNFHQSELYISLRSPFARRVRLAFLENGISYKEIVCDVFKPSADLIAINPLVRVPVLRLASSEVLIDSHLILQSFYENIESPLMPRVVSGRAPFYRWQAIATGLTEKTVEYFLDTQRPEHSRDLELLAELKSISERVFRQLEDSLSSGPAERYLLGDAMTQVDLDMASALTYFGLRYSEEWKTRYPRVSHYLKHLESRPHFKTTCPPA